MMCRIGWLYIQFILGPTTNRNSQDIEKNIYTSLCSIYPVVKIFLVCIMVTQFIIKYIVFTIIVFDEINYIHTHEFRAFQ